MTTPVTSAAPRYLSNGYGHGGGGSRGNGWRGRHTPHYFGSGQPEPEDPWCMFGSGTPTYRTVMGLATSAPPPPSAPTPPTPPLAPIVGLRR
jgi:hypothetical protein